MANNPYVNKVQKADGTTIIDITDTTAVASDVASGKYFYLASGEKVQGSASSSTVLVVDTPDSHGGTIREITAQNVVSLQGQKQVTLSNSPQTISPDTGYDGFASVVVTDPFYHVDLEAKDVDLIDYDGTLLYTYTASEFLELSALPSNPTHSGLTAQGWNWTLNDAKEYVQKYGTLVIGQNYTTSDGKTRFYIELGTYRDTLEKTVTIRFNATGSSATGTIDWGDNSTQTEFSGTGQKTYSHTYTNYGAYTITFDVECEDGLYLGYWGSNNKVIVPDTCPRKVEIGDDIQGLMSKAFADHRNLESISVPKTLIYYADKAEGNAPILRDNFELKGFVIPHGCTAISTGSQPFVGSCQFLRYISFPKSMTSIGTISQFTAAFNLRKFTPAATTAPSNVSGFLTTVYSMSHLVIPTGITIVGAEAIGRIYLVRKLIIPEGVTQISANYGLSFPYSMEELYCKPTTPPTLNHNRFIASLPADCVIYVPYSEDHSILEAYQNATNWSVGASKMQEEPQS